jgi:hypothetical protein
LVGLAEVASRLRGEVSPTPPALTFDPYGYHAFLMQQSRHSQQQEETAPQTGVPLEEFLSTVLPQSGEKSDAEGGGK